MLKVCGHPDWDAGWDYPLLEPERLFRRNTRTAVHGAVAEAVTQFQSAILMMARLRGSQGKNTGDPP